MIEPIVAKEKIREELIPVFEGLHVAPLSVETKTPFPSVPANNLFPRFVKVKTLGFVMPEVESDHDRPLSSDTYTPK